MATVTLTVSDTPNGGISYHSSFEPAVGLPLTPAQACALEISNRTRKQWGLAPTAHRMQRGRALVISGPQGSGKTTLAADVAKRHGGYDHHAEFGPSFSTQVRDALLASAKILIIDGIPSAGELVEVKHLLTANRITVRLPYKSSNKVVFSPMVIICTMDLGWLDRSNRRFDVIELGKGSVQ